MWRCPDFVVSLLVGQIYAMAGMQTELRMITDETGQSRGIAANSSALGFSDMHLITFASTHRNFGEAVSEVCATSSPLTHAVYQTWRAPAFAIPLQITHRSTTDCFRASSTNTRQEQRQAYAQSPAGVAQSASLDSESGHTEARHADQWLADVNHGKQGFLKQRMHEP